MKSCVLTGKPFGVSPHLVFVNVPLKTPQRSQWRKLQSVPNNDNDNEKEDSSPSRPVLMEKVTEKVEIGIQNVLAVVLLGALGLSCANVLAKIGVVTFALVSVSVRYTIVGILLAVLVVYIL